MICTSFDTWWQALVKCGKPVGSCAWKHVVVGLSHVAPLDPQGSEQTNINLLAQGDLSGALIVDVVLNVAQ